MSTTPSTTGSRSSHRWLALGVLADGSLTAGFAGNVPVELAGRAVQGAGSALIAPAALTLLFMTFGSSPKELIGDRFGVARRRDPPRPASSPGPVRRR